MPSYKTDLRPILVGLLSFQIVELGDESWFVGKERHAYADGEDVAAQVVGQAELLQARAVFFGNHNRFGFGHLGKFFCHLVDVVQRKIVVVGKSKRFQFVGQWRKMLVEALWRSDARYRQQIWFAAQVECAASNERLRRIVCDFCKENRLIISEF